MKKERGGILCFCLGYKMLLVLTMIAPVSLVPVILLFGWCGPFQREIDAVDGDSAVTIQQALGGLFLGWKFQKAIGRCGHVWWMSNPRHTMFCKGQQNFGRSRGLQFSRHILVQPIQKESGYGWVLWWLQRKVVVFIIVVFSASLLVGTVPKSRIGGIVGISLHGKLGHRRLWIATLANGTSERTWERGRSRCGFWIRGERNKAQSVDELVRLGRLLFSGNRSQGQKPSDVIALREPIGR
mmetsp:Transcript_14068/g.35356  ORF Transcript_14068/g.35356 Transcript_14068/m.35356 type:complete len:240 (-) Transcript_14068:619-1338(-)